MCQKCREDEIFLEIQGASSLEGDHRFVFERDTTRGGHMQLCPHFRSIADICTSRWRKCRLEKVSGLQLRTLLVRTSAIDCEDAVAVHYR